MRNKIAQIIVLSLPLITVITAQTDYDMFLGETSSIYFFERQNSGAGSMSFSQVTGNDNPFNGLDPGQRAAQRRVFC